MKYKLLAIDLDGTLLSKTKHISNKNLDELKKYIDQGGTPVLTTGRSIISSQKFVNQIDEYTRYQSRYVVSFNGAHIKDLINNKTTSFTIPHAIGLQLKKYATQHNLDLWVYTEESTLNHGVYMAKSKFRLSLRMLERLGVLLTKGIHLMPLDEHKLDAYKINLSSLSSKKIQRAAE
jgi:hydroxymethylpyrimidine pyrophosphatase-like HAD family hydrolase